MRAKEHLTGPRGYGMMEGNQGNGSYYATNI